MGDLRKPIVSFGGVNLAATGSIAWRFITGTRPHMAIFTVHKDDWDGQLKGQIGQPGELSITDSRGETLKVSQLTIIHEAPSDGPNRRSFVLADRRWQWQYPLISRDYNVPKKTGDRTAKLNVPQKGFVTTDVYDFRSASLQGGTEVWTAEEALKDVMLQLSEATDGFSFTIDSFPLRESKGGRREFTLQNVILRDQGDAALSRLLSFIPGATLWVDAEGEVRAINGADLNAAENYFVSLPGATWDGQRAVFVERAAIRPKQVIVHYEREVEVLFDYGDNYEDTTTVANLNPARPYLENVIQTVDDTTTVTEYDPITRGQITKTNVPPGTWVRFSSWLTAMELRRPPDSLPWTFDTIKTHWIHGDLDGALGAGGKDYDDEANISMRIQAIKQHFRQTFRINQRFMDRVRVLKNVSAMLLDPYTGTRAPSRVWAQATVIPTTKGKFMTARKNRDKAKVYRCVDYFSPTLGQFSGSTISAPHGPTRVNIIDRDLGIFRLDWIASPYGTDGSFVPCLVENADGSYAVPTRDLSKQEDEPVGSGVQIEDGSNGIFLSPRLKARVMLTVVPGAPNNKKAFHTETVTAANVGSYTQGAWRIGHGEGPDLEVFVSPSEATARFAWKDDNVAGGTIGNLLGLDRDDPVDSGIEGEDLPGYVLINKERELYSHSRAVAAEAFIRFADGLQGRVATVLPSGGVKIAGNMSGATVQVASAPSGKVSVMHEFPGLQKPISRLALMDEGARQVVLGIVRFSGDDS